MWKGQKHKGNTPQRTYLPLGRNLCKTLGVGDEGEVGRGKAPLWNILTNRRNVLLCLPYVGGLSRVFESLDGRVTVNGEPACPTVLHPKCGVVGFA